VIIRYLKRKGLFFAGIVVLLDTTYCGGRELQLRVPKRDTMAAAIVVLVVLALACTASAARVHRASEHNRALQSAHLPLSLNGLVHEAFTLAQARGHDLDRKGGKIVLRHVHLDDDHSFLSVVPLGMGSFAPTGESARMARLALTYRVGQFQLQIAPPQFTRR
jgi:hypothetical protein